MIYINKIFYNNFRNFENIDFEFQKKCNVLFGNNGSGKTNILEGISLLSKGRGLRNSAYSNLINKNQNNFFIKSSINIDDIEYNIDIYTENRDDKLKKIIKVNNDASKDSINLLNSLISFSYLCTRNGKNVFIFT